MKKEYDFSDAKKNPYIKKKRKQITININEEAILYFKKLSDQCGLPYQTLMNLYLTNCAEKQIQLEMFWA